MWEENKKKMIGSWDKCMPSRKKNLNKKMKRKVDNIIMFVQAMQTTSAQVLHTHTHTCKCAHIKL